MFLLLQQFGTICFVIIAKNIEAETWTPPYAKIPFERHLFRQGLSLKTMAIQWSIFKILLTLLDIANVSFGISVVFHQSPDVFQFHVFCVLSMHEIKDYYQTIVRPHTTTYNCLLILHLCILICALQICRIQLFASLQTWKIIDFLDALASLDFKL